MPTNSAFPVTPYKPKECAHCGTSFTPRRHDQKHCGTACNDTAKNAAHKRALQAYRALYHWVTVPVAERGEAMNIISSLARGWRDEDREAGKPAPPLPELMQTRRNNAQATSRALLARANGGKHA